MLYYEPGVCRKAIYAIVSCRYSLAGVGSLGHRYLSDANKNQVMYKYRSADKSAFYSSLRPTSEGFLIHYANYEKVLR